MDKLNLINIFLTVCRCGSFVGASVDMGVDPSTVSKAIHQLEKHLKLRLFNRTTRQLRLTHAGETYQEQCAHFLAGLENCEQQLTQEQTAPSGRLKINLPCSYGQLYVMPMMERFCSRYPNIHVEISLSDDYVDMVGQSIDIAIRSGQLQDSRLVAKKLSPMDFATCASPEFLAKTKRITASNIEQQRWIRYRFLHTGKISPLYIVKQKGNNKKRTEIIPEPALTTTDGLSMLMACKAGIGLMQAPHFLVREAIQAGELDIVQPYYRSKRFSVYAYYSHKDYVPIKVRVFLEHLVNELKLIGENHNTTFLSKRD